jgi:hypothetical protein
MTSVVLLLFFIVCGGITWFLRNRRRPIDPHLPKPNWRCSRGGRDYF